MRDIALLLLLAIGLAWTLRQPWVGALMWTNVSLMSPHVQFGYHTAGLPVGTAVALATLVGLLLTRRKHNPLAGPPMWALLAFVLWICITLPFSIYFSESYPLWLRSMKIFLMLFVTAALIDDRRKLDAFIWVTVVSIGFYGIKGGLFTLATAGNYRVWGPGGFIEGNNEVALAVIAVIPLMRYLQTTLANKWGRRAMGVAMALSAVMALGTYSRGALLGLAAMALILWLKTPGKLRWGFVLVLGGALILAFMPEHWWERMGTIRTYEEDSSALGRINAWWNAWYLALDRPFGGGFMIYFADVFARYSPNPERVHAAHSIYFQVLGEHGFVGLALFLLIGLLTWRTGTRLIAAARGAERHRWAGDLGAMAQVSMSGFAAGGAFLSLAYFDLPYNVMLIVVLALKFVRDEPSQAIAAVPTAQPPRSGSLNAQTPQAMRLQRAALRPATRSVGPGLG